MHGDAPPPRSQRGRVADKRLLPSTQEQTWPFVADETPSPCGRDCAQQCQLSIDVLNTSEATCLPPPCRQEATRRHPMPHGAPSLRATAPRAGSIEGGGLPEPRIWNCDRNSGYRLRLLGLRRRRRGPEADPRPTRTSSSTSSPRPSGGLLAGDQPAAKQMHSWHDIAKKLRTVNEGSLCRMSSPVRAVRTEERRGPGQRRGPVRVCARSRELHPASGEGGRGKCNGGS